MRIEISYPIFKCQHDENIFLARLRELPGYSGITREESTICLRLAGSTDHAVLQVVDEICRTWNAPFRILDEHP